MIMKMQTLNRKILGAVLMLMLTLIPFFSGARLNGEFNPRSIVAAQQQPLSLGNQGPFFHQIQSASSSDGLNWTHDNRLLMDHASVPAAIVTAEGNIRIYYVDANQQPETTNCAESKDGGSTFQVLNCSISGLSASKALDPSTVRLPDGRYRLYYYGSAQGDPGTQGPHSIYSAISQDGVHFTEEKAVFTYPGLVDPDVFWTGEQWLMFVFAGREGTIVARSRDGLSFEYVGPLSIQGWGTTAPVKLDDGRFRLYAFDQPAAQTVASFTSSDGLNWTQEPGVRLTAPSGYQLTDPFVIQLPDGAWKMIYKVSRTSAAQQPAPPGNPSQITGAYLMAFHACDSAIANCRDPRNHIVYLAQSNDGAKWSLVPSWTPFPGSVPDVIRRDDTLYIFTARNEVARYRLSIGTLERPIKVSLADLPGGFVDPSLIVDDQGRLVLFFLHGQPGSDPAGCPASQPTCVKRFGSATEVTGSDGTEFTLDDGDRVTVTLSASGLLRSASDPDVFFDGTRYVMYLSHGPSISVWTSSSLRGTYTKIADLSNDTGGVPSGHFDSTTRTYWTYSHAIKNGVAVIRRAVHPDFSRPLGEIDWTAVLTGTSVGLTAMTNVESPGFAVNTE